MTPMDLFWPNLTVRAGWLEVVMYWAGRQALSPPSQAHSSRSPGHQENRENYYYPYQTYNLN